jgi:hypothetical protein
MNDQIRFFARVPARILMAVAMLLASFGATAQDHQPAAWSSPHELDFLYTGFTSRYSCDGLQDQLRDILLKLGARDDRQMVRAGACGGSSDRPSRLVSARIKVATLQPASGAAAVDAVWKKVTVGGGSNEVDCELLEQVKKDLLPLFTTRNVKGPSVNCIPNQATVVTPTLTLEVLSVAAPAR